MNKLVYIKRLLSGPSRVVSIPKPLTHTLLRMLGAMCADSRETARRCIRVKKAAP